MDGDLAGSLETEADGAAPHLDDVHLYVVADADRLADAAGECEHRYPSMGVWCGRPWRCPTGGRGGGGPIAQPPRTGFGAGAAPWGGERPGGRPRGGGGGAGVP